MTFISMVVHLQVSMWRSLARLIAQRGRNEGEGREAERTSSSFAAGTPRCSTQDKSQESTTKVGPFRRAMRRGAEKTSGEDDAQTGWRRRGNSLWEQFLIYIHLIASGLPFIHWTRGVQGTRTTNPLNTDFGVAYIKTDPGPYRQEKPPRCRVNRMIKPNEIRWAVPMSASGNQSRVPWSDERAALIMRIGSIPC